MIRKCIQMPSVPLKQNVKKILRTVIKCLVFGGSLIKCKTFVAKTPVFAPSLTFVYYRQQVPVTPSSLNSSAAFVLHTPSQECLLWYGQVWAFLI